MRSEKELKELKEELEKLTGFIADNDIYQEEHEDKDTVFSNDVTNTISWVLEEIQTESFRSDSYLNIANLKKIAKKIEQKTNKKLEDYEWFEIYHSEWGEIMSYTDSERKDVFNLFRDNPGKYFTQEQIKEKCNISLDTIEEILLDLKDDHLITRKYQLNPEKK